VRGRSTMRRWADALDSGGLDAAWLVMEKETSFSPVCAATYTCASALGVLEF